MDMRILFIYQKGCESNPSAPSTPHTLTICKFIAFIDSAGDAAADLIDYSASINKH